MQNSVTPLNHTEFSSYHSLGIDPSSFDGNRLFCCDTTFVIFTKKESRIGIDRFVKGINSSWPKWKSFFPLEIPPITFVETDWGLGGGSLGSFLLAIHLKGEYDTASSKYLEDVLGWPPEKSGEDYIKSHFSEFPDPLQAYVTDQIVHELGHIFFLHGVTELTAESDVWFGLGLGLVYDRLIWKEIYNHPSPVFESFSKVWKTNFSQNEKIDQRLINPDTSNDKMFNLIRLQTYGHAKSHAYLSALRVKIGTKKFDDLVKTYLTRPIGSKIDYDSFLTLLSQDDLEIVMKVENEFTIR